MTQDIFGLTDVDYRENPYRTLRDFAWKRIGDQVRGIAIGCPRQVQLGTQGELPLLAYHSDSLKELKRAPFDHAVVVGVELEHGLLRAALAEPDESAGPPSEGEPQPGFAGMEHLIDLRTTLGLHWAPGTWRVVVLLRERCSNLVTVRLERDERAFVDPEVERYQALQRLPWKALSPLPLPGAPWARLGPTEGSPPVPEAPGLELRAAERVVPLRPGATAPLRVAFRLPVSREGIPRGGLEVAGLDRTARAFAPVWLVLLGSQTPGPVVLPLHVPSFEPAEGPEGVGFAEVDLLGIAALASRPQTWFCYAFSGEWMAGPAVVAFVDGEGT
ncbi:hypothetical protein [Pyxidicoccus xibeiensis]|uniref:hypothetical protein n=1 Tax=Pyxidicoccus xibeiensis TaxID=2906759 RepID=UPI0020A7A32B|nr:hypothetical protein [Pyxidicoccus xibeiensis]MCP3139568.1 hypothetical protein [Pyxidicoccus xibeiensis]